LSPKISFGPVGKQGLGGQHGSRKDDSTDDVRKYMFHGISGALFVFIVTDPYEESIAVM
jgi:hypothetical protein